MKAPWSGRLSVIKTGWLVALLIVVWVAFLFMPAPKEPRPASSVKPPPSRLIALGLPDNPDLEHLPEFFSVFADQAEWKNEKTIFAYWHPGVQRYEYFFEATRANGKIQFRELTKRELFLFREFYDETGDYVFSDYLKSDEENEKFVFTTDSPSHPFILFKSHEMRRPLHGKIEQPSFYKGSVPNPPHFDGAPLLPTEKKPLSPPSFEPRK